MTIRKTITTIFMLPTLKIPREALIDNGFVNAYSIDSMNSIIYEDCVHILFKPRNSQQFDEFLEDQYENNKSIVDDYDYPDSYVVVVYKLDPNYKRDFDIIRQGKYSKTSKKFQDLFPTKIEIIKGGRVVEEMSLQYRAFNRTTDLIDFWEEKLQVRMGAEQEVWHGFDLENETLTESVLKSYEKVES